MRWRIHGRPRENADADDRLAAAEAEVELSRQRLRETRERVVKPLDNFAAENNFAGIIAASLARGHRRGTAE